MKIFPAAMAAALLVACGGGGTPSGGGTATVTGAAGSLSIAQAAEAVSFTYAGAGCSDPSKQEASLVILISGAAGHCAGAKAGKGGPAGNVLGLQIVAIGSGAQAAIGAGTYPVTATGSSGAAFASLDATGCATNAYAATSGTITLTSVSSSGVSGSYSLSFVDGNNAPAGTVTGSFQTAACSVDGAVFCGATANHC